MNPQLRWKFILILIVILICLYGLLGLPTFPTSLTQVKANLADRIKLGLDLKGGSHLVLQVQVDEAIGTRTDQAYDALQKALHGQQVPLVGLMRTFSIEVWLRGFSAVPTFEGHGVKSQNDSLDPTRTMRHPQARDSALTG